MDSQWASNWLSLEGRMNLYHVHIFPPLTISFPSPLVDVDTTNILLLSTVLGHFLEVFFFRNPYMNNLLIYAIENTLQVLLFPYKKWSF